MKMWEFEVLMRDSGMSGVYAGFQAKSGMVGNYVLSIPLVFILLTLARACAAKGYCSRLVGRRYVGLFF